ncbi:MAG TPA: hypothetical protein VF453_15015 [Burkholderiaceae bacterium]
MAIAQAGLAFRARAPIEDLNAVLAQLFDDDVAEVASPVSARFDIRNRSDVMVQLFGDVCFVSNDELAWPLLAQEDHDARRVHASLGAPALMLAFCRYDAGGSHGYAVFEHGRRVRRRLQTLDVPGLAPLAESGAPLPFEQRWLKAAHYIEAEARPADGRAPVRDEGKVYYLGDREVLVPARELTGRMLHDGLEALFGVCPWDTLITPTYRFFRVGRRPEREPVTHDGEPPSASAGRRARRSWWRLR